MAKLAKKVTLVALFATFATAVCASTNTFAEVVKVSDFATLESLVNSGGEAKLMSDLSLTGDLNFNSAFTLDLNGKTVNAKWKKLNINSAVTIDDTSATKDGRIYDIWAAFIADGATLTLNAGRLENDYSTVQFNDGAHGNLVMKGGTIAYTDCKRGAAVKLNGNSIFTMDDGTILSICNTSTNSSIGAVALMGANDKFVMNGGKIDAPYSTGVAIYNDSEVTINGGEITAKNFAISSNGTTNPSDPKYGNNAKITVNGGTMTSTDDCAIYAPAVGGITTINGGTITGKTGIEIRAGDLTVTGGTITGNNTAYSSVPNGGGSTTLGAGIVVSQHTTKQPINVTISGGTVSGLKPLALTNPQGNSAEDLAKISIGATGGEFISTSDEPVEDDIALAKFLSGGVYSNDVPAEYIVDGYTSVQRADGKYEIVKIHSITIADDSVNYVTVDSATATAKTTVKINATDRVSFTKKVVYIDANGSETVIDGDSFEMPDSDITIKVIYEPVNPPTADDASIFIAVAGTCMLTMFTTIAIARPAPAKE